MSFTCYAADFHDLTLWRALGQLAEGSYVDTVPSSHLHQSLGQAFLELQWHGVQLGADPVTPIHGVTPIYGQLGAGLSRAPRISLDDIFDACAMRPVHWLHLDAGDLAENALKGWQRSDVRPWIVVVSNAGEKQFPWQAALADKGYLAVGATALARFYVLASQVGRGVTMAHLPQDLDQVGTLRRVVQAHEQRIALAEQHAAVASERAAHFQREAAIALNEARQTAGLQRQLHAMFASTSWRVTKPLRWVSRLRQSPGTAVPELGALLVAGLVGPPKALMRRTVRFTLAQPAVRRIVLRLALRHPKLVQRLRKYLHGGSATPPTSVSNVPAPSNPASVLGPRFRMLLLDDCAHVSDLQK